MGWIEGMPNTEYRFPNHFRNPSAEIAMSNSHTPPRVMVQNMIPIQPSAPGRRSSAFTPRHTLPRVFTPLFAALALSANAADWPTLRVTADNTAITQSCVIEIPPGTVIADTDGNGVLHVRADNLVIQFTPGADAIRATATALDFPYGWGGPRDQKLGDTVAKSGLGNDHFGMIARTKLQLPAGRWRFKTLSDDGIRVLVAGQSVIENWTWHGPTLDEGIFEQSVAAEVEIIVEHFEIDGYAILKLDIEAVVESD